MLAVAPGVLSLRQSIESWEIGAGGDRKGQPDHECHVLALEDQPQADRQQAQEHCRDLDDLELLAGFHLAFAQHIGIEIVGNRHGS